MTKKHDRQWNLVTKIISSKLEEYELPLMLQDLTHLLNVCEWKPFNPTTFHQIFNMHIKI